LYLVWRRRAQLADVPLAASWLGFVAVVVLSLAWSVARAANVQVAEQLAAVWLVPAVVVAVVGVPAARVIAFPLAYLTFAVPFGEVLIPWLMDWTAAFTVAALKLTGIPVFREGLYFSIPSGDFEVAKACSGIRYLIACSALGILYAYFAYRSWRKRAIFVAVSLVAPIVANGIRAYLIVIIAHLSSMRLAVGADHLVYGWLFFGLLVAVLFWVGNRFEDPRQAADSPAQASAKPHAPLVLAGAAVLAVALTGVGPYWFAAARADSRAAGRVVGFPMVDGWVGPEGAEPIWYASTPGRRELRASYARGAARVELDLFVYDVQVEGVEMVGAAGALLQAGRAQFLESREAEPLPTGLAPREIVARERAGERVFWYWYVVEGARTTSDSYAKVLEAWHALVHGAQESVLIVLTTHAHDATDARAALDEFARQALARIEDCLGPAASCVAAP